MTLDTEDRCGLYPFVTGKNDWMHPACRFHDINWIGQYGSFLGVTRRWYRLSMNRAEMLNRSRLKVLAYVTIGTVLGAPIWAARKLYRQIAG